MNYLYFAVCQWWNSATSVADSSRTCCNTVVLVEELGNIKNAQPGQCFLHIYGLQIFISLRWQRTYGELTSNLALYVQTIRFFFPFANLVGGACFT